MNFSSIFSSVKGIASTVASQSNNIANFVSGSKSIYSAIKGKSLTDSSSGGDNTIDKLITLYSLTKNKENTVETEKKDDKKSLYVFGGIFLFLLFFLLYGGSSHRW